MIKPIEGREHWNERSDMVALCDAAVKEHIPLSSTTPLAIDFDFTDEAWEHEVKPYLEKSGSIYGFQGVEISRATVEEMLEGKVLLIPDGEYCTAVRVSDTWEVPPRKYKRRSGSIKLRPIS